MIANVLGSLPGVRDLRADYLHRELRVELDPATVSRDEILTRLNEMGFPARSEADGTKAAAESENLFGQSWSARRLAVVVGWALLLIAMVMFVAGVSHSAGVAALAAVVAGIPVLAAAARALRLGKIEMNSLMVIAAAGAIVVGESFEAGTAMVLFGIANGLEELTLDRARRAIGSLIGLMPSSAYRIGKCGHAAADGEIHGHEVPINSLTAGDQIVVRPGERVAADGTVIAGESLLDQSPITGESLPRTVGLGDHVFAGSLNGEAAITISVTDAGDESTLARVSRMVGEARASRSRTERFVDRFASWYTPIVILLALLVMFVGPWFAGGAAGYGAALNAWFHRGLVLLVIACPCALVVSTPITVVCGLQRASRLGMLIKGGEHLEAAARTTAMVFDKTGTLTEGEMTVAEVTCCDSVSDHELLSMAVAMERNSRHPIAKAILRYAESSESSESADDGLIDLQSVEVVRGRGMHAKLGRRTLAAGRLSLFEQLDLPIDSRLVGLTVDSTNCASGSMVFVGTSERMLGVLRVVDSIRDDAKAAVAAARNEGVDRIALLSGDQSAEVERVAELVGIAEWSGDLLPADKLAEVRILQQKHEFLTMIGDGINDAPALAAASLGIAMGREASDLAVETADVILLDSKLSRIVDLIRLSRETRRRLWQNISWALVIKAIVLVLAGLGMATMWMAVAADVGASLLVVLNGMRLLNWQTD